MRTLFFLSLFFFLAVLSVSAAKPGLKRPPVIPPGERERILFERSLQTPLVPLNGTDFVQYVFFHPRPYHILAFFTASHDPQCRMVGRAVAHFAGKLVPHARALHAQWDMDGIDINERMFTPPDFPVYAVSIDASDPYLRAMMSKLHLGTPPFIGFVHADLDPMPSQYSQMQQELQTLFDPQNLYVRPLLAWSQQSMAEFLLHRTGVHIEVPRSLLRPVLQYTFVLLCFLLLASLAYFGLKFLLRPVRGWSPQLTVLMALCLGIVGYSMGGGSFLLIRQPPWLLRHPVNHEPYFIMRGGIQNQFGFEGIAFGIIYVLGGLLWARMDSFPDMGHTLCFALVAMLITPTAFRIKNMGWG